MNKTLKTFLLYLAAFTVLLCFMLGSRLFDHTTWPLNRFEYIDDFFAIWKPALDYWLNSLTEGQLPLWSPFEEGGRPFYSISHYALLYPPVYLFAAGETAGSLMYIALHLSLGSLAVYSTARLAGRGQQRSFVSGLFFSASGFVLFWVSARHLSTLAGLTWTAWLFRLHLPLFVNLRRSEEFRAKAALVAWLGLLVSGELQLAVTAILGLSAAALFIGRQGGPWSRLVTPFSRLVLALLLTAPIWMSAFVYTFYWIRSYPLAESFTAAGRFNPLDFLYSGDQPGLSSFGPAVLLSAFALRGWLPRSRQAGTVLWLLLVFALAAGLDAALTGNGGLMAKSRLKARSLALVVVPLALLTADGSWHFTRLLSKRLRLSGPPGAAGRLKNMPPALPPAVMLAVFSLQFTFFWSHYHRSEWRPVAFDLTDLRHFTSDYREGREVYGAVWWPEPFFHPQMTTMAGSAAGFIQLNAFEKLPMRSHFNRLNKAGQANGPKDEVAMLNLDANGRLTGYSYRPSRDPAFWLKLNDPMLEVDLLVGPANQQMQPTQSLPPGWGHTRAGEVMVYYRDRPARPRLQLLDRPGEDGAVRALIDYVLVNPGQLAGAWPDAETVEQFDLEALVIRQNWYPGWQLVCRGSDSMRRRPVKKSREGYIRIDIEELARCGRRPGLYFYPVEALPASASTAAALLWLTLWPALVNLRSRLAEKPPN